MAKAYLSGANGRGIVVTENQTYILISDREHIHLPQRVSGINIKMFLKEPITEMEADEHPFPKVYEELHTLTIKAFKEKKEKEKEKAAQEKKDQEKKAKDK
jgi:hypothetical protein